MVEYRVLSSAMMKDTKMLSFVWRQLCKTVNAFKVEAPLANSNLIVNTINNSDVEMAKKICDEFDIL